MTFLRKKTQKFDATNGRFRFEVAPVPSHCFFNSLCDCGCMGEGKHAGPASRWWHCGKEQRPQCLWKVAGNDSHGVGSTRDVFLIYTYKIRISLTHCKPIFPYAPCWPVFFCVFFQRRRAWSEAIGFYVSLAQRAIEASQKSLTALASSMSEASWNQENHMISEKPCHWSHSLFLARQAKADLMLCWHFVSVLNQWWI